MFSAKILKMYRGLYGKSMLILKIGEVQNISN